MMGWLIGQDAAMKMKSPGRWFNKPAGAGVWVGMFVITIRPVFSCRVGNAYSRPTALSARNSGSPFETSISMVPVTRKGLDEAIISFACR
jgi:hypothetical protein